MTTQIHSNIRVNVKAVVQNVYAFTFHRAFNDSD
jgi:hypothetical protein